MEDMNAKVNLTRAEFYQQLDFIWRKGMSDLSTILLKNDRTAFDRYRTYDPQVERLLNAIEIKIILKLD